jgi:hypothetical protein
MSVNTWRAELMSGLPASWLNCETVRSSWIGCNGGLESSVRRCGTSSRAGNCGPATSIEPGLIASRGLSSRLLTAAADKPTAGFRVIAAIAESVGISRYTMAEYMRRVAVVGITWPVPAHVHTCTPIHIGGHRHFVRPALAHPIGRTCSGRSWIGSKNFDRFNNNNTHGILSLG